MWALTCEVIVPAGQRCQEWRSFRVIVIRQTARPTERAYRTATPVWYLDRWLSWSPGVRCVSFRTRMASCSKVRLLHPANPEGGRAVNSTDQEWHQVEAVEIRGAQRQSVQGNGSHSQSPVFA